MSDLSYVYVFLQSNVLEIPVFWLLYRLFSVPRAGIWRVAGFTTLINLFTHPVVFFAIMPLKIPYIYTILLAEAFAIGAETVIHHKTFEVNLKRAFAASLLANLVSWQLAPMLTFWFFY